MREIHCDRCGGFITNPAGTIYRERSAVVPAIPPHRGPCACDHALGDGAEPQAPKALRGVHHIRSASRNSW